jgi:hypothetical protein
MKMLAVALTVTSVLLGSGLAFGEEPVETPKEILKELGYLVGSWKTEGRTGDEKSTGTWSARWAQGKHCLIEQSSYTQAGEDQPRISAGVIGWDPIKKRITHHNFWSNGECYSLRWAVKSPTEWEGELVGVEEGVPVHDDCSAPIA